MPGTMSVTGVYIAYAVLATAAFAVLPRRVALLGAYVAGWLVLPVGPYPAGLHGFTVEVIGGALPMPAMLVARAWVAPVVALVLAAGFGWRSLAAWRPAPLDLPVALWCAWPLIAGAIGEWAAPAPAPAVASAYLLGTWGAPWLLGRIFLADADGRAALLDAIATGALLLVPAALVEGVAGPFLYAAAYGPHPFADDGAVRYLGYRPLLFFENGNQYGIAAALAALAAVVAWRIGRQAGPPGRFAAIRAAVLVGAALLSQSVGAIALLGAGMLLLRLRVPVRRARRLALAGAVLAGVAAPLYVSGALPIEAAVRGTAPGQALLAAVRATGRGSIAWRVSQDQKVAPIVRRHPVIGTGRWDWWRAAATRPWGLALLILGQFGLVGLALATATLLLPAGRAAVAPGPDAAATTGLALLVVLAGVDALLNAFVFLPALVAAGAVVGREVRPMAGPGARS